MTAGGTYLELDHCCPLTGVNSYVPNTLLNFSTSKTIGECGVASLTMLCRAVYGAVHYKNSMK